MCPSSYKHVLAVFAKNWQWPDDNTADKPFVGLSLSQKI